MYGNATGINSPEGLSDFEPQLKQGVGLGTKIFGKASGTYNSQGFIMSLDEAVDLLKRRSAGLGEDLLKNSRRVLIKTGIFNADGTPNPCIPAIEEPRNPSEAVSCRRRKNGKIHAAGAVYFTDLVDENGRRREDFVIELHRQCIFVASARSRGVKVSYSQAKTEILQHETERLPRSTSVIHCTVEQNGERSASVRHM